MLRIGLTLAVPAVLVVGSTAAAAAATSSSSLDVAVAAPAKIARPSGSSVATVSGMSRAAKKRKLKRCRKVRRQSRRKACVKRVKKLYASSNAPASKGRTVVVDVRDKYFSPDIVELKTGDSILWVWNSVNHDAHSVNLVDGPLGVRRGNFATPNAPSTHFEFKRTFLVPGTYRFACSLHYLMTMTVEVGK